MVSWEEVQRVTQQQLRLNFSHGDVAVGVRARQYSCAGRCAALLTAAVGRHRRLASE